MSNEILQFCSTDTGTNLLTEAEYLASSDRISGNKPGVASSKLNNRAIRQSAYVTSQLAQFVADVTGTSILDDATPAKLLSQMKAALEKFPPVLTTHLSSSGTHNVTYIFKIASGSATAAATYTNNAFTYTVKATVSGATEIYMTGPGVPLSSGTLTKASGTGDSTLTFYAVRAPIKIRVRGSAGGGGGGGSSTATDGGTGGDGSDSTFGTSLLTLKKGLGGPGGTTAGGQHNGVGGSGGSLGTGPTGLLISGGDGGAVENMIVATYAQGGNGGANMFGGAGSGGSPGAVGTAGKANSGAGGGGGGNGTGGSQSGAGGGAGECCDVLLSTANIAVSTFPWTVGGGGIAGAAGTGGVTGSVGGSGFWEVTEEFQ